MTVAQRNERVNEKQSLYQLTLQDLENAQKELEVATNLHDEDDEDDEDNLGFQNTDRSFPPSSPNHSSSERIVKAEKRILEVKELLELYKADLEEEESLLADLIRSKKSSRASCSKEVAVAFLRLFPIERLVDTLDEMDSSRALDISQCYSPFGMSWKSEISSNSFRSFSKDALKSVRSNLVWELTKNEKLVVARKSEEGLKKIYIFLLENRRP
jgi:hypothetical protein